MAKNLNPGDRVTVNKLVKIEESAEAYKQGLKQIAPGDVGRIVDKAEGRKVLVEFEDKRVIIANLHLELAKGKSASRRGRPPRSMEQPGSIAPSETLAFIDYGNPDFVKEVANTLLSRGGVKAADDTPVLEVKLSDLPDAVQEQIRALMQAKLELSAQPKKARGGRPKKT